jgi:hypothetical protein
VIAYLRLSSLAFGELVHLQEVDLGERPAILRRYLECASGARSRIPVDRRLSVEEFEDIADQYPSFM